MAKKMYVGVDGTARKVSKAYIGADGLARKVKKGYIGVGGVARPFLTSGIEYFGLVPALSEAKYSFDGTTLGEYAIFGGGNISLSACTATVDAYHKTLTRTSLSELSLARRQLSAAITPDYAIFAGGNTGSDGTPGLSNCDAYSGALVKTTCPSLSFTGQEMSRASIGQYALFGAPTTEYASIGNNGSPSINAISNTLTRVSVSSLNAAARLGAATSVGDYALFGGGSFYSTSSGSTYRDTVTAYNSSLTKSTPPVLSKARAYLTAVTIGNYALFAGGRQKILSDPTNIVDAYDATLTRITPAVLFEGGSISRNASAATQTAALIFIGTDKIITSYDANLVATAVTGINHSPSCLASVEKYILLAGGSIDSVTTDTVEGFITE